MDRPDRNSKPRGSVGSDVEQGAVDAAEEHAGGHDPAQKLEAPPGPYSHGVPPRRSTPALPLSPRRWLGEAIAGLEGASEHERSMSRKTSPR